MTQTNQQGSKPKQTTGKQQTKYQLKTKKQINQR
jgi:hypothetical protein